MKALYSIALTLGLAACHVEAVPSIKSFEYANELYYEATTFEEYRLFDIESKNIMCSSMINLIENNDRYHNIHEYEYQNKYKFVGCREKVDLSKNNYCKNLIHNLKYKWGVDKLFLNPKEQELCVDNITEDINNITRYNYIGDMFSFRNLLKIPHYNGYVNVKEIVFISLPKINYRYLKDISFIEVRTTNEKNYTIYFKDTKSANQFIAVLSEMLN
jgi:hypothetical protein